MSFPNPSIINTPGGVGEEMETAALRLLRASPSVDLRLLNPGVLGFFRERLLHSLHNRGRAGALAIQN